MTITERVWLKVKEQYDGPELLTLIVCHESLPVNGWHRIDFDKLKEIDKDMVNPLRNKIILAGG